MQDILVVGGSKGIGAALLTKLLSNNNVYNISRTAPNRVDNVNLTHYTLNVLVDDLPDIKFLDSILYLPGSINLKPFSRLSLSDFREDFEINVIGAIRVIQHYLPVLKKSLNASIVLFSTVAVKLGMPYHASVSASKAAIEGVTKSLGAELAPKIRVNAIAPTVTNTSLASKILRNERMIGNMKERHPLKRFLEPDEVAEMATFLISEKSNSMSGQVFEMDCGIVSLKI